MKVVVLDPPVVVPPKFPFIWRTDSGSIYMRINETQDVRLNGCPGPEELITAWDLQYAHTRRVDVTITNEE